VIQDTNIMDRTPKQRQFARIRNTYNTAAVAKVQSNADEFALALAGRINEAISNGALSNTAIANWLDVNQVEKRRYGATWTATDIKRTKLRLRRINESKGIFSPLRKVRPRLEKEFYSWLRKD